MRIGIDIRLGNESGVGRYIRNLVKWLKKIDKQNEYVLFGSERWNVKRERLNVLPVNLKWHSVKEQMIMPYLLMREKLDLVHFPYFNVPIFYPGKFIVTIHDLIIEHFDTGRVSTLHPLLYKFKRMAYKLTMLNAVRRAEKIIVPSKATKSEVLEHYGLDSEKVVVIYEGTNREIPNFKFQISNKFQIPNFKFKTLKPRQFFLYVGNAYPHKNLERLLRAFLRLKELISSRLKGRKKIKLVLAGKEDFFYKRLKRKTEEMKLRDSVIFMGYVSDEELKSLYQNAVALVIPSLMEGFGLPALEAMANGCLILASDIPVLREICGQAAVYFDPEREEELGDKLYKSYKNYNSYKTKAKLKKGFTRVRDFSWEKMARETLKVYESCFSVRSHK